LPCWLWSSPLDAALAAAERSKPIATPSPSASQSQRGLGAGLTLAVSVGLFAYGGQWLDARYGTKPWLLLLCVGCGITGGILHMIWVVAPELWPFGKPPKAGGPPDRPTS
jgi:F0F1-type ATP synthase assembly protein I